MFDGWASTVVRAERHSVDVVVAAYVRRCVPAESRRLAQSPDRELAGGHDVAVVISRSEAVPDNVEEILRDLPEWFGIEEALTGYVEQARVLPT